MTSCLHFVYIGEFVLAGKLVFGVINPHVNTRLFSQQQTLSQCQKQCCLAVEDERKNDEEDHVYVLTLHLLYWLSQQFQKRENNGQTNQCVWL